MHFPLKCGCAPEYWATGLFWYSNFLVSLPAVCPWSCSFQSSHGPKQAAFKISVVLPSITNLTLHIRNAGCLFELDKADASLISHSTEVHIKIKTCFPLFLLFQLVVQGASNEVRCWGTLQAIISLERALRFTNSRIHTVTV